MSKTRLFIATTYYPQFVDDFYKLHPELTGATYADQFNPLMQQGFGFGDVWKYELEKTGLFEVELVVINIPRLQHCWANEHRIPISEESWMEEILIEQIQLFKPDVLFAHDRIFITPSLIRRIRSEVKSIYKVISWDGIALCDTKVFEASDMILSCGKFISDYYVSKGISSEVFPFAFDQRILDHLHVEKYKYAVSFAGSLTLRKNGHFQRLELLRKMDQSFLCDMWLSSFDDHRPYFYKMLAKMAIEGKWKQVFGAVRLSNHNHGDAFGLFMLSILASSRITLNSHIDTANKTAGNSRLWEATGVGACLVTDWKENINDIFIEDKEVVTYKSPEECVEKVRYLLDHPAKAEAIAQAGQQRTLNEYSYEKRLKAVIPYLLN